MSIQTVHHTNTGIGSTFLTRHYDYEWRLTVDPHTSKPVLIRPVCVLMMTSQPVSQWGLAIVMRVRAGWCLNCSISILFTVIVMTGSLKTTLYFTWQKMHFSFRQALNNIRHVAPLQTSTKHHYDRPLEHIVKHRTNHYNDFSNYVNHCWNIVNWALRNKRQWNLNHNLYIFIQENTFETIVWNRWPSCLGLMVVNLD